METRTACCLILAASLTGSGVLQGQSVDPNEPASTVPRSSSNESSEARSRNDAPSESTEKKGAKTRVLFQGEKLEGWTIAKENVFDRRGEVRVEGESIVLESGNPATGIRWDGPLPKSNYELRLEAKRIEGSDFFCGLTFPVGDEYCTFIVGGWGGGVTGLSNIDDMAAVENETTDFLTFRQDKWYAIRLRVTDQRITAWIDDQQMLDVTRDEKKFSIWWEQEPLRPLGIATWHTKAAFRKIVLEEL
jgi:hypothetical protein